MVDIAMKELYQEALKNAPSPFEAGQIYRIVTGRKVPDFSGEPTGDMRRNLCAMLEKRRSGVPLQYLLGEWEFYSLPFLVGPGVLIPRQDTETLVDASLDILKKSDIERPRLLDLCSGSGCVAVAIKANFPRAEVAALEFSPDAFGYLTKNIARNDVDVRPILCDLRKYTPPEPLDMLIANPPYIPRGELKLLQPEVGYEPAAALDGGADGLRWFRAIASRYKTGLRPGGALLLETGAGQHGAVADILAGQGFSGLREHVDLNGVVRVVEARLAVSC